MESAFLGQAYQSRSPMLASQTAVNIYPEVVETTGSDIAGFNWTPGLLRVFQASGEVRGLWCTSGISPGQYYLFAVIGNTVYRLDKSYNAVTLGTLPNNSGRVSMADNGLQLSIYHQNGMHWIALTGSVIAPVSGAPSGGTMSALDNYVVFSENVGGEFGISALGDVSSIDPLDVATAEGWPDDCIGVLADHREVWLFGTETTEIWSDTGAAFFPFERVPGGFIEQGCAAKFSPAKLDNSIFWLGRDRNGQGVVYRANAYIPVRVSTHAIEFAINDADISDAIGFAYQEEGHLFYELTLPSQDQTWVYDVNTGPMGAWHKRAYKDSKGLLHRHRANCHAFFYGVHLVGDFENGKIYAMSHDYFDDDGDEIYRERAWELPSDKESNSRTRIDSVEVVALSGDTGSFNSDGTNASDMPQMWMQISKDAGATWSYERFKRLGPIGQRKARCRWRRLGSGRNIVLRVATTMRNRVSWVAGIVTGEVLKV